MDSLSSVSPSIVLPQGNPLHTRVRPISISVRPLHRNIPSLSSLVSGHRGRCFGDFSCRSSARVSGGDGDEDDGEEVERALRMDGTIPGSSNEFVERVSSRAYDMRRNLQQTFDSSSYDDYGIGLSSTVVILIATIAGNRK